jgi:hypothetical protein
LPSRSFLQLAVISAYKTALAPGSQTLQLDLKCRLDELSGPASDAALKTARLQMARLKQLIHEIHRGSLWG